MNYKEQLKKISQEMKLQKPIKKKREIVKDENFSPNWEKTKLKPITLKLPNKFSFKDHDIYCFEELISFFDWDIRDMQVKLDLTECKAPNYQAISLLVLYAWKLKDQGCTVSFIESDEELGASTMWRRIGGRGAFPVLFSDTMNFKGNEFKPLFAVRGTSDFKKVIETADSYLDDFNVEYLSTLRYVLSELLYNTIEHGWAYGGDHLRKRRIPSVVQFTWYQSSNEIHFIIADCGIGIKRHLEQTYPGIESHEEAIKLAIKPQVSGTFGKVNPYTEKNNAGMGMFISSNIIRRLKADMHVLSGDGLLHISPRDVTGKTLESFWPGTMILVTIKIEDDPGFLLHKIMQEFRNCAVQEQMGADESKKNNRFYVAINNHFGTFAEDKEAAIRFRDNKIFAEIKKEKLIVFDFEGVISAPHSFLSALLASPIKSVGITAYKVFKFVNTSPEIRETIDFIFDDNT